MKCKRESKRNLSKTFIIIVDIPYSKLNKTSYVVWGMKRGDRKDRHELFSMQSLMFSKNAAQRETYNTTEI
jgi:hypothetical protein